MLNPLRAIDELENYVESLSTGFMGSKVVNEMEFLAKLEAVRSALLEMDRLNETGRGKIEAHVAAVRTILGGSPTILGKKWISEEQFFTRTQILRAEIPQIMVESECEQPAQQRQKIAEEEFLRTPARFLERVQNGESFEIVREGQVIAQLLRS